MAARSGGLEDKVAIVTGASSGMGAGIAEELAHGGADVALVGRDTDRLGGTVTRVEAAGGGALPIAVDLTEDGSAARVVEDTLARFGRLDILVNAAGIFELAPFEESLDAFDRQWRCNVRAPFVLTQAAIPHLRKSRGSVLFMSSIAGHIGFATASGYCAAKGAIESLVRVLAVEEAATGVTVNAIAPGNIRTSMNEALLADPAYEKAMLAATPAGRIGEVVDIVPAAAFLVSDGAKYITGASLVVDGGWTAQ